MYKFLEQTVDGYMTRNVKSVQRGQDLLALSEMFELFGQERFRRAERAALERILEESKEFVLATGGSIVTEPATFELLLASCFTIWLRAETVGLITATRLLG